MEAALASAITFEIVKLCLTFMLITLGATGVVVTIYAGLCELAEYLRRKRRG